MSQRLVDLRPTLKKTAAETEQLILMIEKESEEAEKTRSTVAVEEMQCNRKAAQSRQIRDECEQGLKEAMPAFEASTKVPPRPLPIPSPRAAPPNPQAPPHPFRVPGCVGDQ